MIGTEIRLYNFDSDQVFYRKLTEEEVNQISSILKIDINFNDIIDKENI